MIPEYIRPRNSAEVPESLTPVVGDGSNVFDPEEGRNDVFSETVRTRNTRTHVPYRGNEQHGVEFNTPAEDFTPYSSEQDAFSRDVDPTVTPRDVVPVKPVPVSLVNRPDLIHPDTTILTNIRLTPTGKTAVTDAIGAMQQVVGYQQFRKSVKIRAHIPQDASGYNMTTGAGFGLGYWSLKQSPNPADVSPFNTNGGLSGGPIIELEDYWGPIYFVCTATDGNPFSTFPVELQIIQRYATFEGEPLL